MKKVLLKNENKPPFRGAGGQNQRNHGGRGAKQMDQRGWGAKQMNQKDWGSKNKEIKGLGAATKKQTKWTSFTDQLKKKTIRR
jgi:hypothetical protein